MDLKILNSFKAILFIGIAVYLAFNYNDALLNLVSRSGISWVIGSIVLRLIITISFARGFQLIISLMQSKIKAIASFLIGMSIGFGLSFLGQPIYSTDYGDQGDTELKLDLNLLKEKTNSNIDLNGKNTIIAYFSTNCRGCQESAAILGTLQSQNLSPQIIAIFAGTEEDAKAFMKKYNGENFQHYMVTDLQYFQDATDFTFPAIFLVDKKGSTIMKWNSSTFNYSAFDLLKSHK